MAVTLRIVRKVTIFCPRVTRLDVNPVLCPKHTQTHCVLVSSMNAELQTPSIAIDDDALHLSVMTRVYVTTQGLDLSKSITVTALLDTRSQNDRNDLSIAVAPAVVA